MAKTGARTIACFKAVTASSAADVQANAFLVDVSAKRGSASVAACGMNALYHMTRPRNDLTCFARIKGVVNASRVSSLAAKASMP